MTETMVTKEALRRVFGPRAFGDGLFYAHEMEGALRFELSLGGHRLDQFEQAYDRGREILYHLFRDSERLVVVAAWCGGGPLPRHLSVFRSIKACGVRIAKPRAAWTEATEDCWGEAERTVVAFACEKEALHRLLWGAIAVDLGVRPRLACRLYLADPARGILAHPYDDRGMDVIGPNTALLRELYDRFDAYLLDYDRARMDAFFRDGPGRGMTIRIVSGGQTGVDRAALDVALEMGMECGGWCPAGRRAEDGEIDARYPLAETPSADSAQRTEWNVRDSDATLLVTGDGASPGTELTREIARRLGRPLCVWAATSPADAGAFRRWLRIHRVRALNVAGPRESESPGIYRAARDLLRELFADGSR